MNDKDLELPPGIADAELWRQRVRALLAAAGEEGLVLPELVDAIEANHGERFDHRRVKRWLRAEQAAELVDEDDDGMWQVRLGLEDVEDYLRGLDDSGTPELPESGSGFAFADDAMHAEVNAALFAQDSADESGCPGLPESGTPGLGGLPLEFFVLGDEEDTAEFVPPRCRVCGCTEDAACPGGCCWVPDPWQDGDLCSACLPPDPAPTAEQLHRRACQDARAWLAEQDIVPGGDQLRDAMDGAYPGGWNQFLTDRGFPLGL